MRGSYERGPKCILGVDPGLAHFGWGILEVDPFAPPYLPRALACGVLVTKKSKVKDRITADNTERGLYVATELDRICRDFEPVAICAEAMSFPRSSSAAAKMSLTWGMLMLVSVQRGIPLLQASPQKVKDIIAGSTSASKQEVQRGVLRRLRKTARVIAQCLDRSPTGDHEHAYDALAAGLYQLMTSADTSSLAQLLRS